MNIRALHQKQDSTDISLVLQHTQQQSSNMLFEFPRVKDVNALLNIC